MTTQVPRPGDHVVFVDAEGKRHEALVLRCPLAITNTSLHVTLIHAHYGGTNIQTTVPHKGPDSIRFYWCWPNELDLET